MPKNQRVLPTSDFRRKVRLDADADPITHLRTDRDARAAQKEPAVVADRAIAGRALQLVVRLEQSIIAKLRVAADGQAVIPGPIAGSRVLSTRDSGGRAHGDNSA